MSGIQKKNEWLKKERQLSFEQSFQKRKGRKK